VLESKFDFETDARADLFEERIASCRVGSQTKPLPSSDENFHAPLKRGAFFPCPQLTSARPIKRLLITYDVLITASFSTAGPRSDR